jgi:hypothetical protein
MDKALRRARRTFRARFAPRGGVGQDRRPVRVIQDSGAVRRIRKALEGNQ